MTDHRTDRPGSPVFDDPLRTTDPLGGGVSVETPVETGPPAGEEDSGSQPREAADAAAQQGRELADSARAQGAEVASTAREQGTVVVKEAGAQAREVIDHTLSDLRGQAEEQTTRASDALSGVADQVRALADGRPEDAGKAGDYARDIADQVGDIAERIDSLGFDGVVREVGDFARRRPGVFLAGAAVAGLLAGRFVRNAGGGDSSSSSAPSGSASTSPVAAPLPSERGAGTGPGSLA